MLYPQRRTFWVRSQYSKKELLASSYLSAVHTEQFGSQWTDLHETGYLRISRSSVEKFQAS